MRSNRNLILLSFFSWRRPTVKPRSGSVRLRMRGEPRRRRRTLFPQQAVQQNDPLHRRLPLVWRNARWDRRSGGYHDGYHAGKGERGGGGHRPRRSGHCRNTGEGSDGGSGGAYHNGLYRDGPYRGGRGGLGGAATNAGLIRRAERRRIWIRPSTHSGRPGKGDRWYIHRRQQPNRFLPTVADPDEFCDSHSVQEWALWV